jgi:hypothetical protein
LVVNRINNYFFRKVSAMVKKAVVLGLVLLCCGMGWAAESPGGSLAVGYDEGLVARYQISRIIPMVLPEFSAYLGLAYYVHGADTVGEQPLNCFAFKLGGEYTFRDWEKFRLHAFVEWREEMVQQQVYLPGTPFNNHERYNQWNSIFRTGIRPEFFINNHFSFDYRLGLQLVYHSSDFKPNDANTGIEKMKNGHAEFGVYEARFPPIGKDAHGQVASGFFNQSFLLAIGFNIYIF